MDIPSNNTRFYTSEEKQHLLANLDIEVSHRIRQFESWLQDRLENFNMHQEGQVSRIPRQVRNMTMREFGEKYNGNIQAALRGFQKEKLVAAGGIGTLGELDQDARKRKWIASQETVGDEREPDSKNARLAPVSSPKRVAGSSTGPGTAQRARLVANGMKTPTASRTMGRVPPSPSPQKPKPPFGSNLGSLTHSKKPSRPTSPVKPSAGSRQPASRVPSSSTFKPELPSKTPKFPSGVQAPAASIPTTLRLPRKDESMLSVNGSPLANPYQFDPGWFGNNVARGASSSMDTESSQGGPSQTLKRSKSSILVRRDPSASTLPSLTHSQTSAASNDPLESQSESQGSSIHSSQSQESLFPTSHLNPTTPGPRKLTRSVSALVAIPTKDGHLLEFDPLQASPGTLDALEGVSDSAKKQARVEMGILVQAAVDKWKLG